MSLLKKDKVIADAVKKRVANKPPLVIRKEPVGYLSFDTKKESICKVTIKDGIDFSDVEKRYNLKIIDNTSTKHPELGAPLSLVIYPTLKCNQQCKFCYISPTKNHKRMTYEIIDAIFEYIDKKGIFSIDILGGEPFLPSVADISIKIIFNALSRGMHVYISSNGFNIQDKHIQILKEISSKFNTFDISISLHGQEPTHNKLTQSNSYSQVIKTLTYLDENNIPYGINTVVTSANFRELPNFYSDLIAKFSKRKYWLLLYPMECGLFNIWRKEITPVPIKPLLEKIDSLKALCTNLTFNIPFAYKYYKTPLPANPYEKLYVGCSASRTKVSIMPNGDIYPCCFLFYLDKYKLGNIVQDGNFWERKTINRKEFKVIPDTCKNFCEYYDLCDGCLAHVTHTNSPTDMRCPHISDNLNFA